MKRIAPLALAALLLAPALAHAQGLPMLGTLADLGVSPQQALGGAQALMNVTKGNLDPSEYSQLLGRVPQFSQLMDMSDAAGSMTGMMGGASSAGATPQEDTTGSGMAAAQGVDVGDLQSLMNNADLVSQFTDLGMSADMIGKFAPVLVDVASKASPEAAGLLRKGLGLL